MINSIIIVQAPASGLGASVDYNNNIDVYYYYYYNNIDLLDLLALAVQDPQQPRLAGDLMNSNDRNNTNNNICA